MFHQVADRLFSSVIIVGCMLIVTGFFLWATRWIQRDGTITPDLSIKKEGFSMNKALVIGLVQGMAVIPGISRSGSTIVTGLFLGLNRETAARYSFLLSIPAIMGAEILSLKDSFSNPAIMDNVTLIGTFSSFVVGYAALRILLYLVKEGRLHFFAPYCWIIGIMAIISGL
ncbi:MAG: undecaprenyl-diphosphate phosphatase, partial [Deltaproteobacteria bacterium]|nr:undecaprenyl-diphosphate phosphatase [Deltaproteobacteria bacterium]